MALNIPRWAWWVGGVGIGVLTLRAISNASRSGISLSSGPPPAPSPSPTDPKYLPPGYSAQPGDIVEIAPEYISKPPPDLQSYGVAQASSIVFVGVNNADAQNIQGPVLAYTGNITEAALAQFLLLGLAGVPDGTTVHYVYREYPELTAPRDAIVAVHRDGKKIR